MSQQKTNTVKLGIFVTLSLVLFTIAVYNIGNHQNLFGKNFRISSIFQNVNGLQAGNNVRYAGINVGSVEQIVILNDSTLRVDMLLEKKVQAYLKKDAIANIGSDGLVGSMIVNISPGKGEMPHVEDGDLIQSYTRIEAGDMLNTLGNTTENIALLSLNLLEIAENINSGKGSIAALINDPSMAKDLQLAIENLRRTTQHVNVLSAQIQASVEAVTQGEGLLGYLLKDSLIEQRVNLITAKVDTVIDVRVGSIMDNLQRSSQDIALTSAELKSLIQQLDLNQGLIGTILNDTSITKDLERTMQNLNRGTDRFNQNMEALKHNFLFRKYFKKLEKEREKELKKATVMNDE